MIATNHNPLPEAVIDDVIARHPERTGDVLGVLEELQQRHPLQYLPAETQAAVARKMGVAHSQIFSVVSFYAFFNRQPQGRLQTPGKTGDDLPGGIIGERGRTIQISRHRAQVVLKFHDVIMTPS